MAGVSIQTQPLREGGTCQIEVTGSGQVEVVVAVGGIVIGRYQVVPPTSLQIKVPPESAGKTLRVSVPGDFASSFILAAK